jgi:hypothetical protein
MTPALAQLLQALRDELSDWAGTSERLEVVIGDGLTGRKLSAREIEAVQALDGLSQHLRQLSQLCGDLGSGAGHGGAETDALIRASVARLNLGGLGGRLAAGKGVGADPVAGEAELW